MSDNDNVLKYTFDADASKFVSEAKKAKAAAEDVARVTGAASGSSNNADSGSGPSSRKATDNINAQNKAWEQHAQKVSDVAAKYRMLEQARSKFEKNPQAIGEINKQQVALLKTMERASKNEQEYGKFLQARLNLQKQTGAGPYSNGSGSSSSSGSAFGAFALSAGGLLLRGAGAAGRQLYQTSIGSYANLNNQYRFDNGLIASQNSLANAQFRLGSSLSGYQQFKNNALASVYNSPIGTPLAIGGDLLGMVSGPASTALNLAAAYKILRGGAGAAGAAGAVGGAAEAGAGAAATGAAAGGLGLLGSGLILVGSALAGGLVGMGVGNGLGHLVYGQNYKDQGLGDIKDTIVKGFAIVAGGAAGGLVDSNKGSRITRGVASIMGGTNNSGDDIGSLWADLWGDKSGADKIRQGNLKKDQQKQTADDQSKLDAVKDTPAFQRQFAAIQNQVDDHYQDLNRQGFQTQRDFSRQQQDIARSRSRENEDYGIQQQKFGIQQGRTQFDYNRTTSRAQFDYNRSASRDQEDYTKNTARTLDDYSRSVERTEIGIYRTRRNYTIQAERLQEDYAKQAGRAEQDYTRTVSRAVEDYGKTVGRAVEDYNRTVSRAQEDYSRTVSRALEDYTRSVTRSEEDFNRSISRAYQDYSKTTLRAIQDYGITAGRATEDANRDRLRSDQDYARSRLELERNTARSLADINRGLKEGLISIIAPGLASSQGYQIAKLLSDTARQKQRLGEDTQFSQQGLDLNYSRQQEDILRSETRTLADAMRSLSRGLEDANITLSRSLEDATLTLTRSLEDAALTYSRTLEDASVTLSRTLEDASVTLSRTLEDASISLSRTLEDAGVTFSRAMQDLGIENARASFDNLTQANDSLVDASLALRDANITEARSLEDLGIQHTRTMQDIDTQYQRTIEDAQTSFTRAMQDLTLDEKDAAKEHTRNLADLALAEQRGKEDFDFTMQGIKITADRWQRDILMNLDEFDQSMATQLGTSLQAIKDLTDKFRQQMGQQPQNSGSNSNNNPNSSGGSNSASNPNPYDYGDTGSNTDPNTGTSHAKGFNNVPRDEYPARLHVGEMVITRGESETLRQAGYRPESKNLGQAMRNLFMQNAPGYADGYNGGANQTPAVARPWYLDHPEWTPGTGSKWLEAQASGSNVIKPFTPTVMDSNGYTPEGSPWKIWTSYGNKIIMPDGQGGDSAHPYKLTTEQGQQILQSWQQEQRNNPVVTNPITGSQITPQYEDVMPPEFNPNSPFYDPMGLKRTTPITRDEVFQQAMNRIQAMFHGNPLLTGTIGQGTSSQAAFYAANSDRTPGIGSKSSGGISKLQSLPQPSSSRQIPQMQVSQGFASNGQPHIILKPVFNLSNQDQVAIITKALKKFKTDVEGQLAELSNTQATRTGYYA